MPNIVRKGYVIFVAFSTYLLMDIVDDTVTGRCGERECHKKKEETLINRVSPFHMFSQQKNLYCDLLKIVLQI